MGESEKKVGLIFFPVAAAQKPCPSVMKNPGMVACGYPPDPSPLRFPWGRAFEAEPRLGWVPADRGPFLVR